MLPGRREFATELVPLVSRAGMLLFITFRPPSMFPRRTLHQRFARFCDEWTSHYLILLEWGSFKADPYGDSEKGDGEHFHALVWVPDYDSFVAALHAWGDKQGIHRKARDWEIPSGWARHRDHERSHDLRMNVCRTFNYMTKPPDDGGRRDFVEDAIVSGVFETAWRHFCNETATTCSVATAPWFCPVCSNPHPARTTGRPRIFCGNTCRSRAYRNPRLRKPRKWIVRRRKPRKWVVRFIGTEAARRSSPR